jgi:DNA-binding PadR family transcriptional regulator
VSNGGSLQKCGFGESGSAGRARIDRGRIDRARIDRGRIDRAPPTGAGSPSGEPENSPRATLNDISVSIVELISTDEEIIMNGSFDAFNGFGFGQGGGKPGAGIWEAMEQLRDEFERRVGPKVGVRMGRGDVRAAVLTLLAESPMHGYQIIHEIEERSGGSWKPSPGSVYPTLQLLADEGLITAEEANGRKTYALTEAGQAEVDASADKPAPWQSGARPDTAGRMAALPKAGVELAQAAAQVARTGTPEQVQEAVAVLDEARRRLYSFLAQD